MSLATKVAYNTIAQTTGKIISTFLGLLAVGIMTRYLGQTGFGEYTTVVTFASIFAIIADLGLTLVTTQMINRNGVKVDEALGNLFGFRLVSAVAIIGLAPLTIWLLPYSASIKMGVVIISGSYLFFSFNQIFVSLFQKELKTHLIAIAEICSRLVLVIGVFLATWFNWGLNGILISMVVANLFSFLMHYLLSLKIARVTLKFDLVYWREIFSRSWPLLMTIVLNLVYLKADIFILSLMKSQADVGLYGAAYKVVDVLVALPFMFAGLVLPILVKHWSNQEKDKFYFVAQKFFEATVLIVMPLLVGGYLLSDAGMRLVAGEDFAISGQILKILLPAVGVVFFSCFFTHLMISFEAQKKLIKYYLLTALTAVPVYLYLIDRFSYYGAAWGTVYSETLILLCAVWAVWRHGHFMPKFIMIFKALLACIVMMSAIFILRSLVNIYSVSGFIIVGVLATLSYLLGLQLMGILRKKFWRRPLLNDN